MVFKVQICLQTTLDCFLYNMATHSRALPVLHPPFRASVPVTLHPCTTVPTTSLPLLLETDSCLLDQLRSKKAKYFIFIYSSLMLFLSSWRSEFLTHIIFLFPEELLMFLVGQVCGQQIPLVSVWLRKPSFLIHF